MPTVHFTDAEGTVRDVQGNPGDSVMETAVRNGVPGIVAECGGSLSCATCHVFVREDCLSQLPPMEDMEDEMLYGTAVDRRTTRGCPASSGSRTRPTCTSPPPKRRCSHGHRMPWQQADPAAAGPLRQPAPGC